MVGNVWQCVGSDHVSKNMTICGLSFLIEVAEHERNYFRSIDFRLRRNQFTNGGRSPPVMNTPQDGKAHCLRQNIGHGEPTPHRKVNMSFEDFPFFPVFYFEGGLDLDESNNL